MATEENTLDNMATEENTLDTGVFTKAAAETQSLGDITTLEVTPSTGSGSSAVSIKSLEGGYTGRVDRTTVLVAKLDGYDRQAQINVLEQGSYILTKVSPTDSDITVSGDGETIKIKVSSNYSGLTLSLRKFDNAPIAEGQVTLTVNGEAEALTYTDGNTQVWKTAEYETGNYKKYEAEFTIVVPENTSNSEESQITIGGLNALETSIQYTLTREATTKYIYVGDSQETTVDITIPLDNTAQTVNISANAAWTIKQQE